jgi:flagellar operon protein
MDDRMFILPGPIRPPSGLPGNPSGARDKKPATSFDQILDSQLQGESIRFSKHAAGRMESRGIRFNAEEINRLQSAVDQANAKGARDSLVLLGETALVVSVRNSTVVTVMDKESLKGNVFTNIDSAVIA